METIHSVAHLMQQNYYMLKIDLKDTYYSVKMLQEHTKYLKFFAGSKLLESFSCYQMDCPQSQGNS